MRKIIIDVNFSQTNVYCIQKFCLMKYTEGDSPIIIKGGVRGTTFPEGVLRPPYAESSAVGRDAKFNEVVKGVIVVFKIIFFFNGLRWLRWLRRSRGGLHFLRVCGKYLND